MAQIRAFHDGSVGIQAGDLSDPAALSSQSSAVTLWSAMILLPMFTPSRRDILSHRYQQELMHGGGAAASFLNAAEFNPSHFALTGLAVDSLSSVSKR